MNLPYSFLPSSPCAEGAPFWHAPSKRPDPLRVIMSAMAGFFPSVEDHLVVPEITRDRSSNTRVREFALNSVSCIAPAAVGKIDMRGEAAS